MKNLKRTRATFCMNKDSKILITGSSGLAGYWLKLYLDDQGYTNIFSFDLIDPHEVDDNFCQGDICDAAAVKNMLNEVRPEYVFHLAAIVGNPSYDDLYQINVKGTENLLQGLVENNLKDTRVLITSSSAVYGDKGKESVGEEMSLEPVNDYGRSKIEQEMTALNYSEEHGLPVIISRAFNNFAPREKENMLVSRIASQVALVEKGEIDLVQTGPLIAGRDYLDTRDVVEAYTLLLDKGTAGEIYNVCAGKTYSVKKIFDIIVEDSDAVITHDIKEMDLKNNIPYQKGDNSKIRKLGWNPSRNIKKTVIEILDFYRNQIEMMVG